MNDLYGQIYKELSKRINEDITDSLFGSCSTASNQPQENLTYEVLQKSINKLNQIAPEPMPSRITAIPDEFLPTSHTAINLPRHSKHRSKRVWKKLMKKVRLSSYEVPDYDTGYQTKDALFVSNKAYKQLKQESVNKTMYQTDFGLPVLNNPFKWSVI